MDSSSHAVVTPDLFWHAVNILVTKPHVVNKRLWGCNISGRYTFHAQRIRETLLLPVKLQDPGEIEVFLNEFSRYMEIQLVQTAEDNVDTEVILMELLPKNYSEKHAFQLILLQREEATVTFYDVTSMQYNQNLCPNFSYRFYLQNNKILLVANADKTSKSYHWLMTVVLPQLNTWTQEVTNKCSQHLVNKSLALVSPYQYYIKYNVLKEKYGKELVKIWPECTDPSKFVYEDIAIATYLLLLWEGNDNNGDILKPQVFVDMGCGNGLLVYILTMEGHNGYGIDVRKRKIWDMYPDNIILFEKTITPSNIHTFTEVDWVIGNHSDELTPWIPVIAARSSFECKFFLLPCCAYNFDGTKYQRQNSSKTQYTEYLEYIQKLSEDCGFLTQADRLKIPSTKRICFIGKKRTHPLEEFNNYCENIDSLVKSALCFNVDNSDQNSTADSFKAREPTEKVRNCTQVDKNTIDMIISYVVKYLLEGANKDSAWSQGKSVDISDIVPLLPQDMLKKLKSECGGLQTLFKNNHHIFKVRNGKIQLQYPKTVDDMNRSIKNNKRSKTNIKLKVKECWFHKNHPQGCPLKDADCSFLH